MNVKNISRRRGDTLVEVAVAIVVGLVVALGIFPLLAVLQSNTLSGTHKLQGLGVVQGRMEKMLADLALDLQSPLYQAVPHDFSLYYVTALGNPSAPWSVGPSAAYETLTIPALTGYRLQTTVQYIDDPRDNSAPSDTYPYDALRISVQIVPPAGKKGNPYENDRVETLWYR